MFLDKINDGFWACKHTWAKSANNTKWCLIGCATGEFATLAYFSYSGITSDLVLIVLFGTYLLRCLLLMA